MRYGDVVKGLPVADAAVDGVYASHVLEPLALEDFRLALSNTFRMLKAGGTFRLVVPNMQDLAVYYLNRIERNDTETSSWLMRATGLGVERRPRGWKAILLAILGNGAHLWMWDELSLSDELRRAGFVRIRRCQFGDAADAVFGLVEEADRFDGSCAMECFKP